MTATDSRSQPNIARRIRDLHALAGDQCDPEYNRVMLAAADRIEELEAALQFIADGYDNHNVNHVDYRVKVYQVALDALGEARTERERGE